MTYLEFLAQIRREMEEPSEGVWSDSSFLVWTNQAARDFAKRTKCKRDEQYGTAVVGQYSYEMPDYTLEPVAVYYDNLMLRREDFDRWHNISTFDSTSGTPTTWASDGTSLFLWPTPASAGEIRYFRYRYPDPITEDDDLPFDGEFDDALAYYVKAKANEQVNDWQSAAELRGLYFESVDRAIGQQGIQRQSLLVSTAPREVY